MNHLSRILLLVLLVLFASSPSVGTGSSKRRLPPLQKMNVDGMTRHFFLHVPDGYAPDDRVPLVLVLHGRGGSGPKAAHDLGWMTKADEENFIVAFPSAKGTPKTWDSGHYKLSYERDDVAFLKRVMEYAERNYSIDRRRIFVVGEGSGGCMAYRMAGEMPDKFAAVGVFGGSIGATVRGKSYRVPQPTRPVPLIHIHGMRDPKVPFGGASLQEPKYIDMADATLSVEMWADACGAESKPEVSFTSEGRVILNGYKRGDVRNFVVLLAISYGTDVWPGSAKDRKERKELPPIIDATTVFWDFFKKHSP